MADKPRTFEEVVAAEGPGLRDRIERAQIYLDPAVQNDFHADVSTRTWPATENGASTSSPGRRPSGVRATISSR
jgi:hypothetical protein